MDLNNAVAVIRHYRSLASQSPGAALRHNETFEFLEAAAVLMPRFKLLASEDVQEVLYDDYKQIAYSLNAFYNETVDYLVRGKARTTPVQMWESIFQGYANDLAGTSEVKKSESLGAMILNATYGRKGTVRDYGTEHQSYVVSRELLSYADHEVFDLWVSRPNGISDMARAMSILLKFTHP